MRNINILAIDDEQEQLTSIQNALFASGLPCLPICYDYDPISNKSGIEHVDTSSYEPRVIITDLNLRNGSLSNTMELVNPIAQILKKLNLNGPYLLIFWSGVTTEVENVMNLIQERFGNEITLPLHHSSINKDQYLSSKADPDLLKEKVYELINESALLRALIDWETRIINAAKHTTNSLFTLTKPDTINATYQQDHTQELETILAKIGNETVGILNAAEQPEMALDLGLAPVLNDQLHTISNNSDSQFWKNAAPSIGTEVTINETQATKLNSFYHIENVANDYPKSCRGVFIEIASDVLVNETKRKKLEARLGITLRELIEEEFLSQIVNKTNLDTVASSTKLGFIEISAECDQAQKKTKLHRYVLAALTPLKHGEYDIYNKQNRKSHAGIYRVPDIHIDNADYMLQLTFKYQIGSIPNENIWLGNTKFRLRDQIMTEISFICAQYISRPGIISFK
ncbi:hypothetical protein V4T70_004566 [Vibrio vulnificus]|nr:hypothetical protein [Vibrio vulnificus]EGQ7941150.1 hypothetical protein [Vibrio vulnificus]EHI9278310.1 hypothetical protein [Vibrio vulnificus]EHI9279687.1 hypothetical protein [Vibrio vulnificus]EHK9115768.1 hypothetical protein [Vibrio vulnificus]